MDFQVFLQQLLNGITWGSIYALIALGYTMVYGILRLINFAHGDVYMFGAFMGYYAARIFGVDRHPGVGGALAVLVCSMALSGLLGFLIERGAYRELRRGSRRVAYMIVGAAVFAALNGALLHLGGWAGLGIGAAGFVAGGLVAAVAERHAHHAPSTSRLTALITAIGVSLLLENGGLLVFGADPKFFPQILPSRVVQLGPLRATSSQLIIIGVSLALMAGLRALVMHTRAGRAMRAISFNRDAASLMGIATDRIISLTFVLGSALAAAAGILVGMANPKIEPLMGIMPGLKAFVAAVLGGIGNVPGAVVGGLIMGISVDGIITFTFLVGSMLAAAAGVLVALQNPKIDPYMGILPGLKAFVAAVLGGIGNVPGAVVGGLIMGISETLVVGYISSTYRDAIAFALLIVILLVRPAGLFGTHVPEKV
jgi:branched-chain amino acid transport system permease protein